MRLTILQRADYATCLLCLAIRCACEDCLQGSSMQALWGLCDTCAADLSNRTGERNYGDPETRINVQVGSPATIARLGEHLNGLVKLERWTA